jgi:creatinine amidohydrolase
MKKIMLDELTWHEAADYLARSDIAILPVGTVEIHGPQMPLGCDYFTAWAFSVVLAQKIDALVLPPITYSFTGATSFFAATVGIPFRTMIDFVQEVIKGAWRAGFRRIIVTSSHATDSIALTQVVRTLFEEEHIPALFISPWSLLDDKTTREILGEGYDGPQREATWVAGALKILGKEEVMQTTGWESKPRLPAEPEVLRRLQEIGRVGYYFMDENQHQPPRADVDADKGVRLIQAAADKARDVGQLLAEYSQFLQKSDFFAKSVKKSPS